MDAMDFKEEIGKVAASVAVHKIALFQVNGKMYRVTEEKVCMPDGYVPFIDKDIEAYTMRYTRLYSKPKE